MAAAAQTMSSRQSLQTTIGLQRYETEGDSGVNGVSVLFPQRLPILHFADSSASSLLDSLIVADQDLQWKTLLVKLLPTRTQADILLTYFIEHINWIFQTVHIPTFRREYSHLWEGEVEEADLIWLSLLFTIISLSALYIPIDAVELVGLPRDSIRRYAHVWHHASLQALQAGKYEARPTLTQLQTFSVTQLYWFATNNIETLNS